MSHGPKVPLILICWQVPLAWTNPRAAPMSNQRIPPPKANVIKRTTSTTCAPSPSTQSSREAPTQRSTASSPSTSTSSPSTRYLPTCPISSASCYVIPSNKIGSAGQKSPQRGTIGHNCELPYWFQFWYPQSKRLHCQYGRERLQYDCETSTDQQDAPLVRRKQRCWRWGFTRTLGVCVSITPRRGTPRRWGGCCNVGRSIR